MAHTSYANPVVFSPDGSLLVSGGDDRTIRVWDAQTGKEKIALKGHRSYVHSVAISPDAKTIASGSEDDSVKLWEVQTGVAKVTLKKRGDGYAHAVAFSPDGKVVAAAYQSGMIRLWDVQTGMERTALNGHVGPIYKVVFSPDGKTLASVSHDEKVRIWTCGEESDRRQHQDGAVICCSIRGPRTQVTQIWRLENSQSNGYDDPRRRNSLCEPIGSKYAFRKAREFQ